MIDDQIKNQKADNVSLYFRDLNNGPWISINGQEKFSPASLLKVPLMIALFKIAEQDPQFLKKIIKAEDDSSQIFSQNIKPTKIISPGEEYSIEELIK